jgi:predicted RNA polymerase sigma factor
VNCSARGGDQDDTVHLLLLRCHPSLSPVSQVALTLRAVAGLTTGQVAAGFLVPEATMAQRVSRAKATLRRAGARFERVPPEELPARLHAVRHVLYLLFNEGYTSSAGHSAIDPNLTREAIRLTERLHQAIPEDGESTGLLALMLLTAARTPARLSTTGGLIPLAEQDRRWWDAGTIRRGTALLEQTLVAGPVGPFQLQAAIAGVHAQAHTWAQTDWLQICILYRMLNRQAPSPTVTLNLAIAVGMAHGPTAGLATVDPLLHDASQQRNHRLHAARAHLFDMAGDHRSAVAAYRQAARLTRSIPEQRYLNQRLTSLDDETDH